MKQMSWQSWARTRRVRNLVAVVLVGAFGLTIGVGTASADTPPSITPISVFSSSPQVGDTLTEVPAVWTSLNPMATSIQWMRCDSSGSNCVPIPGQTGSTYAVQPGTPPSGDVGSTIAVQETATNVTAIPPSATLLSATTRVVAVLPVNTSPPTLSTSTPQQGQAITVTSTGVWSNSPNSPTSFAYQWFACDTNAICSPVGKPNKPFTPSLNEVGSTIYVQVVASNGAGSNQATSSQTGPVAPPPVTNITPPSISGVAQNGQTLFANDGSWSVPPPYSYQWSRCNGSSCLPVSGATGQSYLLGAADVGHSLLVTVTATNGLASKSAMSAPTGIVTTPPSPSNTALPTISGGLLVGDTLTAGNGSWTSFPYQFSYQWYSCGGSCSPIPAANAQSYTISHADRGNTLEVQVTAANAAGSAMATSGPTSAAQLNASATSVLALPALAVSSQTVVLVATVSDTSGAAPPEGSVAMQQNGAPIPGCTSIPVATFSPSVNVTCQASFLAANSPVALVAVFTPGANSNVAGSGSRPVGLGIGRDGTLTALDVANPSVAPGKAVTYTASVTTSHGAPATGGTVTFEDSGKAIASCVGLSADSGTAQCTVRYRKAAHHQISALYSGDASFDGSGSVAVAVSVRRLGATVRGVITSKMRWEFLYTPGYTRVLSMILHQASRGTMISVACSGRGCPALAPSASLVKRGRQSHQTVSLSARLKRLHLRPGTVLTIRLARAHWIGKQYVFVIRSGRAPRVHILCVAPGRRKAGVGC